jgi:pimeloyl-ACP methyl ester carboxylesterase
MCKLDRPVFPRQYLFGVVLLIFLFTEGLSQASGQPFPNSEFTSIQGLELHHRTWLPADSVQGNILLIHGFCGSTFSWRNIVDSLLDLGLQVRAVDTPPFGYSDRSPKVNHSPSFQADLLWQLLDSLDRSSESWHLMGHSMGGAVVGAMASRRPHQTRSVVFVDGATRSVGNGPKWWFRWLVGTKEAKGIGELVGRLYFFHYRRIEKILLDAYGHAPDSAAVLGYLAPLKLPHTAGGVFDLFSRVRETFPHEATDLHVPVLIIWGDRDSWVPIEAGKRLHKQLPQSRMIVFPGAAHCPMETHPAQFMAAVRNFLAE